MTAMDSVFVGLAAIQLIAVGWMAWVAMQMLETARKGQRQVQPAVREVKALVGTGKALAEHARKDGQVVVGRVKAVVGKVRERLETTRRIALEIRPSVRETASELQSTREDLARTASTVGDVAQRLSRVGAAARSATRATRPGGGVEG